MSTNLVSDYSDKDVHAMVISSKHLQTVLGQTCLYLKMEVHFRGSEWNTSQTLILVPPPGTMEVYRLVRGSGKSWGVRHPNGKIFLDPPVKEQLPFVVVEYSNVTTGNVVQPIVKVGIEGRDGKLATLAQWETGGDYVWVYGNRAVSGPNGLQGVEAVKAMIAGLEVILTYLSPE